MRIGCFDVASLHLPKHFTKKFFLQDVPYWMLQNRSEYITQGVDSSHIVDGKKTEEIEKSLPKERQ